MVDKLWFLWPEIILFIGAVVVSVLGLSRRKSLRDASPLIVIITLALAAVVTSFIYSDAEKVATSGLLMPMLGQYVKMIVAVIGIVLAMVGIGMVDRPLEAAFASGRAAFDAIRVTRGEYYAFFLLSLMGVMLCSNANDLIWLFLALELTSLPTYVMVAIARSRRRAHEAAVKYFFLGALAAAFFLFGFAFLYGATGTIVLTEMADAFAMQATEGTIGAFAIVGVVLAILGICFKIAAAPMHFYAADVYEGAAAPVTAFLAFVPKTTGMVALMLVLGVIGWRTGVGETLPREITAMLWMIAVLTMTLGNVLALLQRSVKRILAYSSVAHSGYMIIGLIAGPESGLPAVLFYLLAYGLMNTAAFGVLAALERRGEEIDTLDDLAGLRAKYPGLSAMMAIAALSLIGMPPVLGFVGKLFLFRAGIDAGQVVLVIIAGVNSAVSAWYYLKLAGLPLLAQPTARTEEITRTPSRWPAVAAILCTIAIVTLWIAPGVLFGASKDAFAGYLDTTTVDGRSSMVVSR